jgi:hypothetical protein
VKPAQIAEKFNRLETTTKAHEKQLDQLKHALEHQQRDPALNHSKLGSIDLKTNVPVRKRLLSWSPNISPADVIQILILLILIRTLWQSQNAERRQVRAWVGTGLYNSWIHVPERDTNNLVKWHIGIKNYGTSPALEVNYHSRLVTLDRDARFDLQKQQEVLRLQADNLTPMEPQDGTPIFPGETVTLPSEPVSHKCL